MEEERKIDKAKIIRRIMLFLLIIVLVILIQKIIFKNKNQETTSTMQNVTLGENENNINKNKIENELIDKITVVMKKEKMIIEEKEVVLDWSLLLVNTDNKMPDDYNIQVESIDQHRSFDTRAAQYLTQMMEKIRYAGISDIWIQSAYRTPKDQQTLFENQVQAYIYQGYSEETARKLTEKTINKPWHSEHNLGLAVDFNYVNREFENTDAFQWLQENAQDYGFVLRYPENKEDITKVSYEPWHWRYVGIEHAKAMKSQDLCLEEYIEKITNDY